MKHNRKSLLALLRSKGVDYTGKPELAEVKAFLAENAIEIADPDGDKITAENVETVWAKALTITTDAPKDEGDPGDEDPNAIEVKRLQAELDRVKAKSPIARQNAGLYGGKAPGATRPEVTTYKKAIAAKRNPLAEGRYTVYDDVDKAEVAGAFYRLGMCKAARVDNYPQKQADEEIIQKAGSHVTNSLGAALIPDAFQAELIELKEEYGEARQLVGVRMFGGPDMVWPRLIDDVTVNWEGENTTASDQNAPTYNNVRLVARKLWGIVKEPNELLNDSALSVADILSRSFARATAYKEDLAFFNGDGTQTYGGIVGLKNGMGSAGAVDGAGNTWSAITDADIQKVWGTLPAYVWKRGNVKIAMSNQAFFQILQRLSFAKGGVTYGESVRGLPEWRYNGVQVVISQVCPVATAVSTKFMYAGAFDLSSKFGEVSGSNAFESSDQAAFTTDQVTFRARERIGIVNHDLGDSSTAGPVVSLATTS